MIQRLIPIIESLPSAVIACAGDVMLDAFVQGKSAGYLPKRPSPYCASIAASGCWEAPATPREIRVPLAAGSGFSRPRARTKKPNKFPQLLDALPGARRFLARDSERQTPVKTRYIAHGQQLLRTDRETAVAVNPRAAEELLAAFRAALPECSAVLLSDYAKGVLDGPAAQEFIAAARKFGKPVVVGSQGRDLTAIGERPLLRPNLKELGGATGLPVSDDRAQRIGRAPAARGGSGRALLLTRGASWNDAGVWQLPDLPGTPWSGFRRWRGRATDGDGRGGHRRGSVCRGARIRASRSMPWKSPILRRDSRGKSRHSRCRTPGVDPRGAQPVPPGASDKVLQLAEAVNLAGRWRGRGLSSDPPMAASTCSSRPSSASCRARAACDRRGGSERGRLVSV